MNYYKVIAARAICEAQREKLSFGTVKSETYFQQGQVADLIRRKMIAGCDADGKLLTDSADKAVEIIEADKTADPDKMKLAELKLAELKAMATDKGIDFSDTVTKKELIALLTALVDTDPAI